MEKLSRASKPLVDRVGPAALAAATPKASTSPALQALQRRAALAKRQKERRVAREKEEKRKIEKRDKRQQWEHAQGIRAALVRAERRARREDWEMGALAPRRDAGVDGAKYGTMDSVLGQGLDRKDKKDWGIREGDRVVVVRSSHRDLGKIGKVLGVSHDKQECRVERINMVRGTPQAYGSRKADRKRRRTWPWPSGS
jgi:large subunit ribosomal protein L24